MDNKTTYMSPFSHLFQFCRMGAKSNKMIDTIAIPKTNFLTPPKANYETQCKFQLFALLQRM